jgi:hypothetical protein
MTLVFEKNANFFRRKLAKTQKIAIITLTPGTGDKIFRNIFAHKIARNNFLFLLKLLKYLSRKRIDSLAFKVIPVNSVAEKERIIVKYGRPRRRRGTRDQFFFKHA